MRRWFAKALLGLTVLYTIWLTSPLPPEAKEPTSPVLFPRELMRGPAPLRAFQAGAGLDEVPTQRFLATLGWLAAQEAPGARRSPVGGPLERGLRQL